jgi:hypothetical protein
VVPTVRPDHIVAHVSQQRSGTARTEVKIPHLKGEVRVVSRQPLLEGRVQFDIHTCRRIEFGQVFFHRRNHLHSFSFDVFPHNVRHPVYLLPDYHAAQGENKVKTRDKPLKRIY